MSERNTELAYLIAVSGLTAVGFASVYIARRSEISWGSLAYAGFFIVLYLVAHMITRRTVPNADPYDGGPADRDRLDGDLPPRTG
jgi:hypothetical protein